MDDEFALLKSDVGDSPLGRVVVRAVIELPLLAGERKRGVVFGVAQQQRHGAHFVFIHEADAEVERAGDAHRFHRAVGAREVCLRVRHQAVHPVSIAPIVGVGRQGEETRLEPRQREPAVAAADFGVQVRRQIFRFNVDVPIQRGGQRSVDGLRLGERVLAAIAPQGVQDVYFRDIALVGVDGVAEGARQRPGAVVPAETVVAAAVVGEAVGIALGVPARAHLHAEHPIFRYALGADINVAAAERSRHFRREALLHRQRIDDVRGEDVERQHIARQVRRGHRGAVELGAGVALAEATHIDELALRQGEPGQAPQRLRHVAVAGAADGLGVEHVEGHVALDAFGHDVRGRGLEAAQHHHLLDGVGVGLRDRWWRVAFGFLGHRAQGGAEHHDGGNGQTNRCVHGDRPSPRRGAVTRTTARPSRRSSWPSNHRRRSPPRGIRRPCRHRHPYRPG